jgi:hypothetical protein
MPRTSWDWASQARHALKITSDEMLEQRLGTSPAYFPGISVVYGNDDLDLNPRALDILPIVRAYLAANRIKELGFASDFDGGCWAMLVRSKDPEILGDILQEAEITLRRRARPASRAAKLRHPAGDSQD